MKLEDAIKSTRFADERHKAMINLMYTAYWAKSHVSTVLKDNGLTAEQFNVLRILKGKHPEPMCVRDIASRMIEKSSNVPRIIDRLVEKKLAKRTVSKEDKRETLITLTDKGMQQTITATTLTDEITNSIIGVTNEEAAQLNELLEKIRQKD
ncbi:MAG: winged helix DNA-binding protein [Taibaiella sp.]|nr:winged helix DNA-binding protein [Taibaiella sp.]